MAPSFADVIKAEYVSLTTFTKDGRPKPTPIWIAPPDGDRALVITGKDSWKVKRIRNTPPRVTVAVCDRGGKVKGEPVDAVATILDDAQQIERVYTAIGKRYGLLGKVFNFFSKLRGGSTRNVGLELRAADASKKLASGNRDAWPIRWRSPPSTTSPRRNTCFSPHSPRTALPSRRRSGGVPDGDRLLVITDRVSWKVKRIRNTPRVTIAESHSLGKPKGPAVEATARVLPDSETRGVYNKVLRRYWQHSWWFYLHSLVRGGIDKVHVALEITPAIEITGSYQPTGTRPVRGSLPLHGDADVLALRRGRACGLGRPDLVGRHRLDPADPAGQLGDRCRAGRLAGQEANPQAAAHPDRPQRRRRQHARRARHGPDVHPPRHRQHRDRRADAAAPPDPAAWSARWPACFSPAASPAGSPSST